MKDQIYLRMSLTRTPTIKVLFTSDGFLFFSGTSGECVFYYPVEEIEKETERVKSQFMLTALHFSWTAKRYSTHGVASPVFLVLSQISRVEEHQL